MLWLVALYSFLPATAGAWDKLGGNVPNIRLYYSFNQDTQVFTIRGIEMIGGFRDQPVSPCGLSTDPSKNTCVTSFSCGAGVSPDPNSPFTIHHGYRATDRQIYNAMQTKIGQPIQVFAGGQCLDLPGKPGSGKPLRIMSTATRSDGGGVTGEMWGEGSTELVPEPPAIDPECTITANGPNNSVVIDYDTVLSTTAQGLEKSAQVNLSCKREAFVKMSVPTDEVSLLADGTLNALIHFSKPSQQKVLGSVGLYTKLAKLESQTINVISTLKVKGTLAGGDFKGSTVITFEYL